MNARETAIQLKGSYRLARMLRVGRWKVRCRPGRRAAQALRARPFVEPTGPEPSPAGQRPAPWWLLYGC